MSRDLVLKHFPEANTVRNDKFQVAVVYHSKYLPNQKDWHDNSDIAWTEAAKDVERWLSEQEAFVKKYFPKAELRRGNGGELYDIMYNGSNSLLFTGPLNHFASRNWDRTPLDAWLRAANEVREWLEKQTGEQFVKQYFPSAQIKKWPNEYYVDCHGVVNINWCGPTPEVAWKKAADSIKAMSPSLFKLIQKPDIERKNTEQLASEELTANMVAVKMIYRQAEVKCSLGGKYFVKLTHELSAGGNSETAAIAWQKAAKEVSKMCDEKHPSLKAVEAAKQISNPCSEIPINEAPKSCNLTTFACGEPGFIKEVPKVKQKVKPMSYIQRLRSQYNAVPTIKVFDFIITAYVSSILVAFTVAGLLHAIISNDLILTVLLGTLLPLIVGTSAFSWFHLYAIATRSYVPTPSEPKGYISWMLWSLFNVAVGYGAYWLQNHWSSLCFDLGVFLQRLS